MPLKHTYWFVPAALILGFGMVCMSVSRYYSYQAAKHIVFEEYIKVDHELGKALSWMPVNAGIPPFGFDLQGIHYLWGLRFLSEAKGPETTESIGAFPYNVSLLEKAREHFLKAVTLNPYDIKLAKGLAETTFLLEKDWHRLYPAKENPYNALPCYQTLSKLRPAGITVRKASLAMARLAERKGDLARALECQQRGMAITTHRNSLGDYICLGRLFLETGDNKAACKTFEKAFAESDNFNDAFTRIYQTFHKLKSDAAFLEFAESFENKYKKLPGRVHLQTARTRIDSGLYEPARKGLIQMIEDGPDSEAYYLLAVIAEKQGQWGDMESNIQKATVLNPDECKYYNKFAQALYKQGKNTQAKFQQEKAAVCKASNKK